MKNYLNQKKKLHFILDEFEIISKKDIENVEEFLILNNAFFTEIKKELSLEEKNFMKNYRNVTLV